MLNSKISFQRSVNVEFDLDTNYIEIYKPTVSSINTINRLIDVFDGDNRERAIILSGLFGAGKSFLSVLLGNLFRYDLETFQEKYKVLWNKLKQYPSFINRVENSDIIQGENEIFTLYGNVNSINESIIERISNSASSIKLPNKIDNDTGILLLTEYLSILQKQKKGLLIIFDEFSQFIEKNAANPSNFDVQFLQKLVEMINNSTNGTVILITHKELARYTSDLQNEVKSEWRKIEGRFTSIKLPIDLNLSINLLLESLDDLDIKHSRAKFYDLGFFKPSDRRIWKVGIELIPNLNYLKSILDTPAFNDFWPLHPLSILCLPILSSEVGQNNRSVTSFINSIENYSMRSWLGSLETKYEVNEFNQENEIFRKFINLGQLWDYFSEAIRSDTGFGGKADVWEQVEKTIVNVSTLKNSHELILLIKTIGILQICAAKTGILASDDILNYVLSDGISETQDTEFLLIRLKEKGLIRYHKTRETWELYDGSGLNWEDLIQNKVDILVINEYRALRLLEKTIKLLPLIPRRSNYKQKLTRYYYPTIKSGKIDKLLGLNWKDQFTDKGNPDGIIIYFPLVDEDEIIELNKIIPTIELGEYCGRVIFVLPKKPLNFKSNLYSIYALEEIQKDREFLLQDSRIAYELEFELSEQIESLEKKIQLSHQNFHDTSVFIDDQEFDSPSRMELSKICSQNVLQIYNRGPIINQELFNKNGISGVIKKELEILFAKLLTTKNKIDLVMIKNPAHVIFYKTIMTNSNLEILFDPELSKQVITFPNPNNDNLCFLPSYQLINEYFDNSPENIELGILYEKLREPPFGLKKPIIALFILLTILSKKENEFLIAREVQGNFDYKPINSEMLIESIYDDKQYLLISRTDTQDKRKQNTELLDILKTNKKNNQSSLGLKEKNQVIPNSVAKKKKELKLTDNSQFKREIQSWYLELSPYLKRTNLYLSPAAINIREKLKEIALNSNSSLDIFEENGIGKEQFKNEIKDALDQLKQAEIELENIIVRRFFDAFDINLIQDRDEVEIYNNLIMIYKIITGNEYSPKTETVKFYENPLKQQFMKLISELLDKYTEISFDMQEFVHYIAIHFTSLDQKDWNDLTLDTFHKKLNEQINQILQTDKNTSEMGYISYMYDQLTGRKLEYTIQELSDIAKILLQTLKSQFEISGRSLSENEKINILNELIKGITAKD